MTDWIPMIHRIAMIDAGYLISGHRTSDQFDHRLRFRDQILHLIDDLIANQIVF